MSRAATHHDAFGMTADPAAYMPRAATERALGELERALVAGDLPVVLSGPTGIGKTVLLRVSERRLSGRLHCVYIAYAALPASELCAWVLGLLGEPAPANGDNEAGLVAAARRRAATGTPLVLLIDDASAVPGDAAERMRALAADSGGSLRLVAAGIGNGSVGDWAKRFGARVERVSIDAPMTAAETALYVRARLERAGVSAEARGRFDSVVLDRIFRRSGGVPRAVNALGGEFLRIGAAALPANPLESLLLGDDTDIAVARASASARAPADRVRETQAPHDVALAAAAAAAPGAEASPPVAIDSKPTPFGRPAARAVRSADPLERPFDPAAPVVPTPLRVVPPLSPPAPVDAPVEPPVLLTATSTTVRPPEVAPRPPPAVAPAVAATPIAPIEPSKAVEAIEPIEEWTPAPEALTDDAYADEGNDTSFEPIRPRPGARGWRGAAASRTAKPTLLLGRGLRWQEVFLAVLGLGAIALAVPLMRQVLTPPTPARDAPSVPEPEAPRPETRLPQPEERAPAPVRAVEPPVRETPPAPQARPTTARSAAARAPAPPAAVDPAPALAAVAPIPVHINASPWAMVEVDGIDMGETPIAGVPLLPGPHHFKAKLPDGRVVERTVEIGPETRHVTFD